MKKGKTCKLNGFTRLKSTYGTVDSKTFKSLYLNIQSWVTPQKSVENWSRVVNILNREIKETINEILDLTLLQPKFILDLDLRTSGLVVGKKSFMNLEITFFVAKNIEFKSTLLKTHLQNLTSLINSHNFTKNTYFKFEKTKKLKTIDII
jgi:Fe-S cluster assembly ATPase SufC